ncbi:MAG: SH3 domain-containing protein [Desulfobaccales bacterium]
MKSFFQVLNKPITLFILLVMCTSCTRMAVKPDGGVYYTIPPVTYFRETPGYASRNVATVYRGEQVEILSGAEGEWRQVKTVKGQQTGWIQYALLNRTPIPAESFYVQQETPLRDTPEKEGFSRRTLNRGDKVRKLSDNQQGWWWVLADKDESLGWLPAATLSERQPVTPSAAQKAAAPAGKTSPGVAKDTPPAAPSNFYVAVASLNLHQLPLVSSQVVKVLKFNDKVERIAQPSGPWLKVRFPETGAQGWAQALFLTASPSKTPKVFPPKKKKLPKRPRPLKPDDSPPEVDEPEVMSKANHEKIGRAGLRARPPAGANA